MSKVDEITQAIGQKFRSFGGGQEVFNNPIATALKDKPFQFAAGVDIKPVVEDVLNEAGFDDLVEALEKAKDILENAQGEWSAVVDTYAPQWTQPLKASIDIIEAALAQSVEQKK